MDGCIAMFNAFLFAMKQIDKAWLSNQMDTEQFNILTFYLKVYFISDLHVFC